MEKSVSVRPRLFRATSTVALMTMLSRIAGFLRDMVLALVFGAGGNFDAFVVAFKIPNFLRRLFGEGAFAQAFVPIMSELRARESGETVRMFVARMAGTLSLVLMLVVVVAEIFAPVIIMVFAPGFMRDPSRFGLATQMLRIIFPYLLLISLTAFGAATLNTCGRFAIPAVTPVLLNIALIMVAVCWAPHAAQPIYVLAWGVLIGGVAQLVAQWPALRQLNLLPWPKLGFTNPDVVRVMKLMVPALFGVSVAQISLLMDNFFASFLPSGSISWLYYSDRLTYLPLGVIGVALATVVLPNLSHHHAKNSTRDYSLTLDWALRCALLIGLPAAVGLLVLSVPILSTLINYGKFTNHDVIMTSKSLMAFAFGLPAFMLVKILASGFYSRQDIKMPVKIAAVSVLANILFIILLIHPFKHAGLALATSLASWFNALTLLFVLLRQKIYEPNGGWGDVLMGMGLALAAMVVLLLWGMNATDKWFTWSAFARVEHLMILIIAGIAMYVIVLAMLGVRLKNFRPPVV